MWEIDKTIHKEVKSDTVEKKNETNIYISIFEKCVSIN